MIADAGGLPVAGGGRMRTGVLLRLSGGLARGAALDDLPPVRTVVDLRGPKEGGSEVGEWAQSVGARYVTPEIDVAQGGQLARFVSEAADAAEAEALLESLYLEILDDYADELGKAINAVADGLPAIIGCTAGKDRTGLTSALIQAAVGVADEDILANYEASPPSTDTLRPLVARYLGDGEAELPQVDVLLGAHAPTMVAALAHVRDKHGGIEAYLEAAGVDADARMRLRDGLVTT